MGGEMVYQAGATRFTDCASGASYPIAMEGDFVALQRAYLDGATKPGAPLWVTFEGIVQDRPRMEEGTGEEPTVVVHRFFDVWPRQGCERARVQAPLPNTMWRIVRLGDQAVSPETGARQPYLLLRAVDGQQTYAATVGCNQLLGSWSGDGGAIAFRGGASSLMACPPSLDELERRLADALARARRWQIVGNVLGVQDETGDWLAWFEAAPG
jgi:heat shock protein HslJ